MDLLATLKEIARTLRSPLDWVFATEEEKRKRALEKAQKAVDQAQVKLKAIIEKIKHENH